MLHRIGKALQQHNRPSSSIELYFTNPNNHQFIPFQQQRDKLGRLIKSSLSNRAQYSPQTKLPPKPFHHQNYNQMKMQEKISKCFKSRTIFDFQSQVNKNKIAKKPIISLSINNTKKIKYEQNPQLSSNIAKRERAKTAKTIKAQHNKVKIQRSQSAYIPKKSQSLEKYSPSISQAVRTSSSLKMLQNNEKIELSAIKQLALYSKRQRFEVRLQPNFEEGHLKFIEKIMMSKKLAYSIKTRFDQIEQF